MLLNSYVNLGSALHHGNGSLRYTDNWDHDFYTFLLLTLSHFIVFLLLLIYFSIFKLFLLCLNIYIYAFYIFLALLVISKCLLERKMGQSLSFSILQMKIHRMHEER